MIPDVPIYDELPEGWKDISDIIDGPAGYHWINNGKSIFDPEYQHGLLRMEKKTRKQPTQLSLW